MLLLFYGAWRFFCSRGLWFDWDVLYSRSPISSNRARDGKLWHNHYVPSSDHTVATTHLESSHFLLVYLSLLQYLHIVLQHSTKIFRCFSESNSKHMHFCGANNVTSWSERFPWEKALVEFVSKWHVSTPTLISTISCRGITVLDRRIIFSAYVSTTNIRFALMTAILQLPLRVTSRCCTITRPLPLFTCFKLPSCVMSSLSVTLSPRPKHDTNIDWFLMDFFVFDWMWHCIEKAAAAVAWSMLRASMHCCAVTTGWKTAPSGRSNCQYYG